MVKTGVALLVTGLSMSGTAFAQEVLTIRESQAPFEDVVSDLEDAIVNRGFVVDYHGRVSDMLSRTAGDVGAGRTLYHKAEFVQFCSASVSRKAMEADLDNIGFCPYVLFAYEAEATPGTVRLGFRRLPQGEARDDVNALLEEIIAEAAGS